MTISDYYSELMKQSFNDSVGVNYTPLAIMLFLKKYNYYFQNETIENLSRFIYRFYSDNKEYSQKNSTVVISNIEHYYVKDIMSYVSEQLIIWIKNGSGILNTDGTHIKTCIDQELIKENEIKTLDTIIESLCIRNFNCVINYDPQIERNIEDLNKPDLSFDQYCKFVNTTRFRDRAFEDMNYCACCEEIDRNNLQPVHLQFYKKLNEPINSIILCKEHARLYYDNFFRFNKNGKIIIYKKNPILDKRMHLSIRLVKTKKEFLEES